MPLSGTRDISSIEAPRMTSLAAEPWEIEGVQILQVMYEIADARVTGLLPKALHPTIPPVVTFTVARYPRSPAGPFTLAQVRLGCRAGVRPRGLLLRAYCDAPAAAHALAASWGYNCAPGEVELHHYHDQVDATVRGASRDVLRVSMIDPEPISGGDIQYTANMNLARVDEGSGERPLLVQVDPEYRFHRAERGRPRIDAFDRAAWNAEGVEPVYPVVASYAVADSGFPRIRYVCDPDVTALAGTRAVGA